MSSLTQLILGDNHIDWFFPFAQVVSIKVVIYSIFTMYKALWRLPGWIRHGPGLDGVVL